MQSVSAATNSESGERFPAGSSGPSVSARFYRPELDWLRFFAFSLVFMVHVFPSEAKPYVDLGIPEGLVTALILPFVGSGGYGVDLFFLLSAYLITEILLLERERTGTIHVRSFYIRRILRVWPLYFAFILGVGAFEIFYRDMPPRYYLSLALFCGNWHSVVFGNLESACSILWSVSVEEQFYITWPLLMMRSTAGRFTRTLWLILAFTCLFRPIYTYAIADASADVWYNTFTRLDGFAIGGLLACYLHNRPVVWSLLLRFAVFMAAILLLWRVGACPYGGYFGAFPVWYYPVWTYPAIGIASGLFLLAFITAPPRATLSRPLFFLSYLGKISYGLYVFHVAALWIAGYALTRMGITGEWLWVYRAAAAGALTLSLAAISYEMYEKPFLRLKQRLSYVESRPV